MTTRVRASLTLIVAVAMMSLAGCDHYNCSTGANFGGGCSASGSGISSSGGGSTGSGGGSIVALTYYVSNNEIGSLDLSSSGTTNTLEDTPNFVLPTLPAGYTNSAIVIAQKQFLYVPYASTSASPSLYAWSIDGSTGALTVMAGSPFSVPDVAGIASSAQPMHSITTDPTGTFLYIADATDKRIDAFQINSTSGVPTPVPGSPFSASIGPWNLAVDGLGHYLYATQGTASGEGVQVEVFTLNSTTGALSNGTTMSTLNMWQLHGEPLGKYMIGVDGLTGETGDNKPADPNVYVFSIGSGGALTQVGKFPTASGNGPTGVVVHPSGTFVYDFSVSTLTNFDGPLDGFALDPSSGALTPLAGSPFTGGGAFTSPDGGHFDQSGTYLFVHAGSAIGVFNIDPSTGIPTEPTQPVGVGSGAVIYPWAVTDPQ
jgi:6-phosphogluconolactonase